MTTEVLILMTQDNQRSAAIAAYSLLAQKSIYELVSEMSAQIIKDTGMDENDSSSYIIIADAIYNNIIGLV